MTVPFQLNPNRGQTLSAQAQSNGAGSVAPFVPRNGADQGSQTKDKPKTKIWANIVLCVPAPVTEENPDGYVAVATTPYGLAIDTMNTLPIKGSPEYLKNVVHPRNALLGKLSELGFSFNEGESRIITPVAFDPESAAPFFALELRRVKPDAVEQNAMSSDIATMIANLAF